MIHKKRLFLLIILLLIIGVHTIERKTEVTITYNKEDADELKKEPNINELIFFNSIDESILASELSREDNITDIKKVIKVLQKEDDAIIFFISEIDGKDNLFIYKVKEKDEEGKILYSNPILTTSWQWSARKAIIKKLTHGQNKFEDFKRKVLFDLQGFNPNGNFSIGSDKNNVKWGLSLDKEIKKLKINGQSPTEIMTIKLDNDDVYFWYYEDLPIDTMNNDVEISA